MKEIGPIYLCWRSGPSGRRHIVGVLKQNKTEGATFKYLEKGVEKAKKEGFTSYTEFPDLSKEYTENVLEIFGQRIIKSERSDINDFLSFWEIDPKYKEDKFYMLAHTQGLNPADNFEFLADYNPVESLRFMTDLARLSVQPIESGIIKTGDELTAILEPDNQFDPKAVRVFKGDTELGYIKKIHSGVFHKSGGNNLKLTVKAVEQNGVVKRAFVKVYYEEK